MRNVGLPLAFLLAVVALPAMSQSANCSVGTRLNQSQLGNLLGGTVVCGRPGPSYPGAAADRWQEEHVGGGQLFDYKLGPSHAVDPRTQVGTWAVSGTGANTVLTHTYGASAFAWSVHGPNSNTPGSSIYYFCNAGGLEFARAYVLLSASGCSGNYPAP